MNGGHDQPVHVSLLSDIICQSRVETHHSMPLGMVYVDLGSYPIQSIVCETYSQEHKISKVIMYRIRHDVIFSDKNTYQ